jgi:hypothetical protein
MLMPTLPVVVAAAVEVRVSTVPALLQSKVRFAPLARFKAAVLKVVAVPS